MRPSSLLARLLQSLKQMPMTRLFFMITCTSFALSFIWAQLVSMPSQYAINENLLQEALKNVARDSRYIDVYRKPNRLPKDLKYILLWTAHDYAPFYYFGTGQRAFIKNNCSVVNCYVTDDKKFFDDVTRFDAIAFNGRNMKPYNLPKIRAPHQKYIFFMMESADNYPVCSSTFDRFFNWTSTYRLDSDIPFPYIIIRDKSGKIVGPKADMKWPKNIPELDKDFAEKLANKSKAAAWFVSHCSTRSGRKELVHYLENALEPFGLHVDIYGSCGPFDCPRDNNHYCDYLLEKDYFFYLSLENSFDEDYVTEKLLTALQHNVVPIVYGGANYSRFLPPGSYLDAKSTKVKDLALIIDRLMQLPKVYSQFFKWKKHYTYKDPSSVENICAVCEALNNKELVETHSSYDHFRMWWNPRYRKRCPWSD